MGISNCLQESNPTLTQITIDKVLEYIPQSANDGEPLIVSLQYLQRFLKIFGSEKLTPIYSFLFRYLETKDIGAGKLLKVEFIEL